MTKKLSDMWQHAVLSHVIIQKESYYVPYCVDEPL